jgi:hypothetical protein
MTRIVRATVSLLLLASTAFAQSAAVLPREINSFVSATPADQEDALADLVSGAATKLKTAADVKKLHRDFLVFRRADVQNGASGGASGTTTAIASPLLPAIFGVAFESGALTRSVSGNTITLKASPAGLFCATGPNAAAVAARDPEVCRTFWKRFGVTAGFDTSRGKKSAELTNLEAVESQFAELAVRAEILNRRLPRAQRNFTAKAQAFVDAQAKLLPQNADWEKKAQAALLALTTAPTWASQPAAKRAELVAAELDRLLASLADPPATLREQWLETLRAEALSDFNRVAMTAEYVLTQPDIAQADIGSSPVAVPKGTRPPSLHTARFIYGQGIGNRNIQMTGNASVSWFDRKATGVQDFLRDIRAGGEVKLTMRDIADYGAPTLSFAGLYVFLNQEPLGIGLTAFNSAQITARGHIRLFQAKLELPTAKNGMRIPLSFSASNRTELIKESNVRGQIGVSFNLDSLFASK